MKLNRWLWSLGIVTSLFGVGCGSSAVVGAEESNTNWLQHCDKDAECGSALACHCGVCTVPCAEGTCSGQLACVGGDSCGESVASCQAECVDAGDCVAWGDQAECVEGRCAVVAAAASDSPAPMTNKEISSEDQAKCDALFADACDREGYDYYAAMCANENTDIAVEALGCVVPNCWSPADSNTAAGCLQAVIDRHATPKIETLEEELHTRCDANGSYFVQALMIHAVILWDPTRVDAFATCLEEAPCEDLFACAEDPQVVPWWMP